MLAALRGALRRFAWTERARIALRELLPIELGGAPVSTTAHELSLLADVTIELALEEASHHVASQSGMPERRGGEPSGLVVFGMGKLGGEELNAGSDVDLIFVYDTDDGAGESNLHDHWTRVVRRLVATLETPSEDGFVWRVDLRLRPEGSSGPLVNSMAATERYYETWGRLWSARHCCGPARWPATARSERPWSARCSRRSCIARRSIRRSPSASPSWSSVRGTSCRRIRAAI